jgi:putative phosphoribosyl transferase
VIFTDRADAGRQLAAKLMRFRGGFAVVLGLPRGGVVVAAQVAAALGAPLDVIVVRKLGVPRQPELGMGAIGEDGARVLNTDVIRLAAISDAELAAVQASEEAEVTRRAQLYRGGRARLPLDGRVALIVDDGVATGSTARAACRIARAHGAAKVVLAVPVAPADWEARLSGDADELICVATPEPFFAIGQFYDDFAQTTDAEVAACLARASAAAGAGAAGAGAAGAEPADQGGPAPPGASADADRDGAGDLLSTDVQVRIPAGEHSLPGRLSLPRDAAGIVVFAHGSGSGRHSPRNRRVASVLNQAGLGTLLLDLLTPAEALSRSSVFDIGLLAGRLAATTDWLRGQPDAKGLPVGYFGASTGAAAALSAAAETGSDIAAVVSRGGRPDLAWPQLGLVRAPTLLIVGGNDDIVLGLNQQAQGELQCENELAVIPGATHLFEEPGALEAAAGLARDWFARHMIATGH